MEYLGVEFNERELLDFHRVFPDSPAAGLLNKLMVKVAERYEVLLHDPASTLEQLRFAQGALESAGALGMAVKQMMAFRFGEESGGEAGEESKEASDDQVEMDF